MKYVKFEGGNGYCGCDFEEYVAFEDEDFNEKAMDDYAAELAHSNAECYDYIVENGLDEDEYDSEEEWNEARDQAYEDYYAGTDCSWKEVTLKEYLENK